MGLTEIFNNWLEARKVAREKRRLDRQELHLKKFHSDEAVRLKKIESANIKAEQARLTKEAEIKSNETIRLAKIEKDKAVKSANASKPSFIERLRESYDKAAERRHEAKESTKKLDFEAEKDEREKRLEERRIDASKPSFWNKLLAYLFHSTPKSAVTDGTTTSPEQRRGNLVKYSIIGILILAAIFYYNNSGKDFDSKNVLADEENSNVSSSPICLVPDTTGKINTLNVPVDMPSTPNLRLKNTTGKLFNLQSDQPIKIAFVDRNGQKKSIDWDPNTKGYNHWPVGIKKFYVYGGNGNTELSIYYINRN